jgi:hypothetical protein
MVIYLGHQGYPCPIPGDVKRNFAIVHTNGIHTVDLCFCGCTAEAGASHARIQLLRSRLLPGSIEAPRTAFTFDILNTFHLITLQGKTSAYDYYLSVEHKSDNVGLTDQKVRIILAVSWPRY